MATYAIALRFRMPELFDRCRQVEIPDLARKVVQCISTTFELCSLLALRVGRHRIQIVSGGQSEFDCGDVGHR